MPPDHNIITNVRPIIGLEVHVELAAASKVFSAAASGAALGSSGVEAEPNTLIDPVVLALPGALPVLNAGAVEMALRFGLAVGCEISKVTTWDRKGYFYPDLPKGYQLSQYDKPVNGPGVFMLPPCDVNGFPDFTAEAMPIRIARAQLEEDAGKLLHELPGGGVIDFSIVDYNRAGTALLEIVTEPDFSDSSNVTLFCKLLRQLCRAIGITRGVMQLGHMRFEPNINCELTFSDGSSVRTPITEVKNLNSFKSVKAAIDHEVSEQPGRWKQDGRTFGKGTKSTRGWDDDTQRTYIQREKEDAHDYRYFPEPDVPPLLIDDVLLQSIRAVLPENPLDRYKRAVLTYGLAVKEAAQLVEEPGLSDYYEAAVDALAAGLGTPRDRAGKSVANILLQTGMSRANERNISPEQLGVHPMALAALTALRQAGDISNQSVAVLFDDLVTHPTIPSGSTQSALETLRIRAGELHLLIEKDEGALTAWIQQVIAANPQAAADVRSGKLQAAGRLVGEVMKLAGGKADAKTARTALLAALGQQ